MVFRKDLTLKRILRRNYYFDYLSQHQSRFPLLKELTEGRLRALCKKTRIRGLVPGPLQFMPTQTAFLIFRGQLSLEEDQRAARKSKKWIYNAWTMVGGRGLAMNDYDELFEESSSMANGNPSAAPTALRRHCRYYIQARQPSVIACITTVGLQDAFQNAKEDLSKLFLRLGNTYTSFYHLLYIPDACNHLLAFIRHQSPPSRDAAATNTATAMPTPSLSTISSTPTPSGLSSPSSSRSTRSYNEQDLIFYIAIQRFEDLYLRLQSFATRSLHPRDWRRVVDIYAQREASALRNIEEIIPKPQSFNISSFLGGGGGGLGSLNAQKSLRDLHVTNPSTIPESDGLLSKGTSTPMTPATTMLLRGQTSSRFNLSPSLSMTLGPPSRQSSAAGLVDQDQDMDPNANSSRLSPRHRSSSQDQDSYRDQHSSHQGKVATPMDLEDEIRHSQLEEEEEVRQTSNDAPDRLLDDKVDASIGKFIPVEQAQEILEQQMKEIRSVVKFLIDSFMPLNQSANILNISPDCIEDTQEHAKAFLEQPIGLSLALFFLALVNKYASSSHGGISASTASIGAMDFSVVDMEGHALNEEKRRLMAALQTISSKSAGPGREDTPMIGAEMIFAGAKQEIYGALYQKVYMKWRDGQAFMLFLKEMVPIDDALSKEYGEEGIGEVSSDTSVHFDGRQRRDDSTTNDYSLRPDKKPSHRSFNPLRCFRKGKKNVKQSYVLPDNK